MIRSVPPWTVKGVSGLMLLIVPSICSGQDYASYPVLAPQELESLLSSRTEVAHYRIPPATLDVLERHLAEPDSRAFIRDCWIQGTFTFGVQYAVPHAASAVTGEEQAFFEAGGTFLLSNTVRIWDSLVDAIDVSPEDAFDGEMKPAGADGSADPVIVWRGLHTIEQTAVGRARFVGVIHDGPLQLTDVTAARAAAPYHPGASEHLAEPEVVFERCWFRQSADAIYRYNPFLIDVRTPTLRFDRCVFPDGPYFSSQRLQAGLVFRESRFDGEALFAGAEFQEPASFEDVDVRGALRFDLARFQHNVRLSGMLTGYLGFDWARADADLFVGLKLSPDARMSLSYATVGGHLFSPEWEALKPAIDNHYGLPSTVENRFRKISALRLLETHAANLGAKDLSLRIYRERRREEAQNRPVIERVGERLADMATGYGTMPDRVLMVATVIVILFAFVYYAFDAGRELARRASAWERAREAALFSAHAFLGGGGDAWRPQLRRKVRFYAPHVRFRPFALGMTPRKLVIDVRVLAFVERALGWLMLALLAATLAKVWID